MRKTPLLDRLLETHFPSEYYRKDSAYIYFNIAKDWAVTDDGVVSLEALAEYLSSPQMEVMRVGGKNNKPNTHIHYTLRRMLSPLRDEVYMDLMVLFTAPSIIRTQNEFRIKQNHDYWVTTEGQQRHNKLLDYTEMNPSKFIRVDSYVQGDLHVTKLTIAQEARLVKDPSTIKPVRYNVPDVLRRIKSCPVCGLTLNEPISGSIKKACPMGHGEMELSTIGSDGRVGVVFHMEPWSDGA